MTARQLILEDKFKSTRRWKTLLLWSLWLHDWDSDVMRGDKCEKADGKLKSLHCYSVKIDFLFVISDMQDSPGLILTWYECSSRSCAASRVCAGDLWLIFPLLAPRLIRYDSHGGTQKNFASHAYTPTQTHARTHGHTHTHSCIRTHTHALIQ